MASTTGSVSQKEANRLGLPEMLQFAKSTPFGGINLTDDRTGIEDNEFYVLENFIRIGKNQLRTLWDRGANLYTAPIGKNIISFFWFSIGTSLYCAVFLSDGTAVQVDTSRNQTVISSTIGTFYTTGPTLPACAQWGTQYLLISNNFAQNNYWAWDGSVLYEAGTISPVIDITSGGSGYATNPTVTPYGGEGSGIVVVPTVLNGSVVALKITNPGTGYLPGDVVQFVFSGGGTDDGAVLQAVLSSGAVSFVDVLNPGTGYTAIPTVTISGGGGSGATAVASISGGGISAVTLTSGGSNYTGTPTVIFTVSGSGAAATATVSGGAVTSIAVTSGGANYLSAPNVTISGVGTGALASATVNMGQVTAVTVLAGGSGYSGMSTSVIFNPSGSGASAIASLTAGTVVSVTVISGGTNFTSTPTLTFEGGGGAGATGTAVLSGSAISSVTLSSGGSDYTSTPAIIVSAGANNSASAIAELMPFIVSGAAIETFENRVWLLNQFSPAGQQTGGDIITSAPGSISDFATSDGGNIFTAVEPFLRQQYYAAKQAQGYLYTLSDSACDVISNVQTSGNPVETTFNYQNVDPQEGSIWRDTFQYYGLSILYLNATGAFGLYGGAVKNLSRAKLTNLFDNAIFPPNSNAVTPCSAIANIHTIKTYLALMTITDPVTEAERTVMIAYNETDWFLASQSTALIYIGTQALNSVYTAYGTDGKNLFPLFSTPSTNLTKRFSTKLYGENTFPAVKQAMGLWFYAVDQTALQTGITFNVTVDSEYGYFTAPVSPLTFPGVMAAGDTGNVYGSNLGLSVSTNSADFILKNVSIGYQVVWGGFGDPPTTLDQ